MNSEERGGKLLPVLAIIAFVAIAAVGFVIGYRMGSKRDQQARLAFYANLETKLYRLAERGNTNKLKNDLSFLIYAHVSEYDRLFGSNSVKPAPGADARTIASQMRTQVVTFDPRNIDQYLTNTSKPAPALSR